MNDPTGPGVVPPPADPAGGPHAPEAGSLLDGVAALLEDGQTYVQAEIAFQKARASYSADRARRGAVLALGALALLHLALIALVVGLVFALAPVLTPFGATAAVVATLMLGAVMLALAARKRFAAVAEQFSGDRP